MASRLDLHNELCQLLGSKNVYYSPPESLKMKYPCIRYTLSDKHTKYADDRTYKSINCYDVTVIDSNPDSAIPDQILAHFSMCDFNRQYTSNNLNHSILKLYY